MINLNLFEAKKYLPRYVTAIIAEGPVKKLRQYLKTTVAFVTIPSQIMTLRYFFEFGTKLF